MDYVEQGIPVIIRVIITLGLQNLWNDIYIVENEDQVANVNDDETN
jgi:hypothetical protein